jgi:hypothetical protein
MLEIGHIEHEMLQRRESLLGNSLFILDEINGGVKNEDLTMISL